MATVTTDSQNYTNIANAIRQKSGTDARLKPGQMGSAILAIPTGGTINNQNKEVTPTENEQEITCDAGYTGLGTVTVGAIDDTYVGSAVTRQGASTITPGTVNQTIASDTYLTGTQTISGDSDLISENIKSGINIFGVTGNYSGSGTDVSDTTAVAADVKTGKDFYTADGNKATGTAAVQMGVMRPDAELIATLSNDVMWVDDLSLTIPAYTTTSKTLRSATNMTPTVALTDLDNYNYFVLERALTIPTYSIETSAKGKEEYQFCSALYEIISFPANTFSTLDGTKSYATRNTAIYSAGNYVRLVYWTSATAITAYGTAAYGCTTTITAPTVSSASSLSPNLTIKFPSLIIRGSTTYFTNTYMNATTDVRTQFVAEVYRVPKNSAWGINGWGMKSQAEHILDCIDTSSHDLT